MHELISRIPAREKTVVTDEDHASLNVFARIESTYTLFQACSSAQTVSHPGIEGTFTFALLGQLRSSAAIWLNAEDLKLKIAQLLTLNAKGIPGRYSPQFVVHGRASFTGAAEEELRFMNIWESAEGTLSSRLNPAALNRIFIALNSTHKAATTAKALRQMGRALLEKGSYLQATEVLERMIAQYDIKDGSTYSLLLKPYRLAAQSETERIYEAVWKRRSLYKISEPVDRKQYEAAQKKYKAVQKKILKKLQASKWSSADRATIEKLSKIKEGETREQELDAFLDQVNSYRLGEGQILLEKLIQRRSERFADDYAEGRVNLGLFYGAAGDFKRAVNYLGLKAEPALARSAAANDPDFADWQRDSWLFMGRWLCKRGNQADSLRGVEFLERACNRDPKDFTAYFFYAEALRDVVSMDLLPTAEHCLTAYLLNGAPLGFEDDARNFIKPVIGTEKKS